MTIRTIIVSYAFKPNIEHPDDVHTAHAVVGGTDAERDRALGDEGIFYAFASTDELIQTAHEFNILAWQYADGIVEAPARLTHNNIAVLALPATETKPARWKAFVNGTTYRVYGQTRLHSPADVAAHVARCINAPGAYALARHGVVKGVSLYIQPHHDLVA